jgi:hypothetical protein
MEYDEIMGLSNREPEMTFEEMTVGFRDSLNAGSSSDNRDDGEDVDYD